MQDSHYKTVYNVIFYFLFGFCALYLLFYHFQLLVNPAPLEYREAANIATTHLMLKGENPYSLEHQPAYTNTYGIIFHYAVYPLAKVFGSTFLVHRAVSAVFLFLSIALLVWIMRREKYDSVFIAASAVFLYANLLLTVTPLGRADTLGLFLLLCTLSTAYYGRFTLKYLTLAVITGILSFYTKSYFAVGIPIVLSYTFLFYSKKRGLLAFAIFLALFSASVLFVHHAYESFFSNTLFSHLGSDLANSIEYKFRISTAQMVSYFFLFRALSLSLIILSFAGILRKMKGLNKGSSSTGLNFFLFSLFAVAMVIYFVIGTHPGNWMTYLFQLLTPFMLLTLGHLIKHDLPGRYYVPPFLAFDLSFVLILFLPLQASLNLNGFQDNWEKLFQLAREHERVFATPLLAGDILKQDKEIHDAGLTIYFRDGGLRRDIFSWVTPRKESIDEILRQFNKKVTHDIENKKFDLILLDDNDLHYRVFKDTINEHYYKDGYIDVEMKHSIAVFRTWNWKYHYRIWIRRPHKD